MKHYSFSAIAITALCALSFSACQQNPESAISFSPATPMSTGAAHPAITYWNPTAIGVMDTDGTHQTTVLSASGTQHVSAPGWSPSGGSIAYQQSVGGGSFVNSIKAMDISVSGGVPVANNIRTIYATVNVDTATLYSPIWSSKTATAKITFIRQYGGAGWGSPNLGLSELCTMPEGGGTVTVLASYKKLGTQPNGNPLTISHYSYPTWSPDDSKIAVIRQDTAGVQPGRCTLMIFDASTGSALDSIPLTGACRELEWSRSGMNRLVYAFTPNSSTAWKLYYVVPSTGSTPTTNGVQGTSPTWSPNNSGIMYLNTGLRKVVPLTATTTSISSGPNGSALKWKR